MCWWHIRKRNADLERELKSDLELEEEEQRSDGLPHDCVSVQFAVGESKHNLESDGR
jgi:hypothetical protein